jgi:hypothetical protein
VRKEGSVNGFSRRVPLFHGVKKSATAHLCAAKRKEGDGLPERTICPGMGKGPRQDGTRGGPEDDVGGNEFTGAELAQLHGAKGVQLSPPPPFEVSKKEGR